MHYGSHVTPALSRAGVLRDGECYIRTSHVVVVGEQTLRVNSVKYSVEISGASPWPRRGGEVEGGGGREK